MITRGTKILISIVSNTVTISNGGGFEYYGRELQCLLKIRLGNYSETVYQRFGICLWKT